MCSRSSSSDISMSTLTPVALDSASAVRVASASLASAAVEASLRTPSNQLIALVENDDTLCVVPIAAAAIEGDRLVELFGVGDQQVGIGCAAAGVVDVAGAVGAAVAQQVGVAADRGIEGGVER